MEVKNYIEINSIFLNNLEELLHRNKINKSTLAKEIGVSPSLITSYYNGSVKKISFDIAEKLAEKFSLKVKDLFEESVEQQKIRMLREYKIDYNEYYYEDEPVNSETFLWFSKIIYETFTDEEFENTFFKTKEEFIGEVQEGKLSLNMLLYLRHFKRIDLNELFEKKSIIETQKMLFNK